MREVRCHYRECGVVFKTNRKGRHKYCSTECRKLARYQDDLDAFREQEGLRPIKSGIVPCCKCEQEFNSSDVVNVHVCPMCSFENNYDHHHTTDDFRAHPTGRGRNGIGIVAGRIIPRPAHE